MKLSTRARYAVMAAVDLAAHHGNCPISLAEIAARQQISLSYLEQIFGNLRRAGVVRSVRGPGGGYALARAPERIAVADVVHAVEAPVRITRCDRKRAETGCLAEGRQCTTHDLWAALGAQVEWFLCSVTLQDVVAGRLSACARASRPLGMHRLEDDGALLGVSAGE